MNVPNTSLPGQASNNGVHDRASLLRDGEGMYVKPGGSVECPIGSRGPIRLVKSKGCPKPRDFCDFPALVMGIGITHGPTLREWM